MKRLLIGITLFANIATAQLTEPKNNESTKLQSFISKSGTLIIKDFYSMESFTGKYGTQLKAEVVVMYLPGDEKNKVKGVKVEVTDSKNEESAFLDADEVESALKAINYIQKLSSSWASETKEYSESIYQSKEKFSFGFYQQGTKQFGFIKCGSISGAHVFLDNLEDFEKLRLMFEKAMYTIKSK
jgi:hypothetical protein